MKAKKPLLKDMVHPGEDALVLIGPEGDFSEGKSEGDGKRFYPHQAWENQGCVQRQRHWLPATSSIYRINDTH